MGYLVAMETCVTLFLIGAYFCMIHSIGAINVCTNFEINRYKIDEFRKHATITCFIWRHVTQTRYVVHHGGYDTSDRYLDQEHFETNQKSLHLPIQKLSLKQWFSWYLWPWPWPWPLTYILCLSHALGMKYWNLHARFHTNRSSINGWYALDKHKHTHTQTHTEGKINSLANPFGARLKTYMEWLVAHTLLGSIYASLKSSSQQYIPRWSCHWYIL